MCCGPAGALRRLRAGGHARRADGHHGRAAAGRQGAAAGRQQLGRLRRHPVGGQQLRPQLRQRAHLLAQPAPGEERRPELVRDRRAGHVLVRPVGQRLPERRGPAHLPPRGQGRQPAAAARQLPAGRSQRRPRGFRRQGPHPPRGQPGLPGRRLGGQHLLRRLPRRDHPQRQPVGHGHLRAHQRPHLLVRHDGRQRGQPGVRHLQRGQRHAAGRHRHAAPPADREGRRPVARDEGRRGVRLRAEGLRRQAAAELAGRGRAAAGTDGQPRQRRRIRQTGLRARWRRAAAEGHGRRRPRRHPGLAHQPEGPGRRSQGQAPAAGRPEGGRRRRLRHPHVAREPLGERRRLPPQAFHRARCAASPARLRHGRHAAAAAVGLRGASAPLRRQLRHALRQLPRARHRQPDGRAGLVPGTPT